MNIIIDTHIFLWSLSEPEKLSENKQLELQTPANSIYLSSISITELMIKASIGKLDINFDPIDMAKQSGFQLLDFGAEDAMSLKDLPFHHKDPFDRMLIAQGLTRSYPIMTDDAKFRQYGCKLI